MEFFAFMNSVQSVLPIFPLSNLKPFKVKSAQMYLQVSHVYNLGVFKCIHNHLALYFNTQHKYPSHDQLEALESCK